MNDSTAETADETLTHYSEASLGYWEDEGGYDDASRSGEEIEEERRYQDQFSRCGFSDEMHQMLLESGKWIYEFVGDPSDETALDLLSLMELGEEYSHLGCCGKQNNCS